MAEYITTFLHLFFTESLALLRKQLSLLNVCIVLSISGLGTVHVIYYWHVKDSKSLCPIVIILFILFTVVFYSSSRIFLLHPIIPYYFLLHNPEVYCVFTVYTRTIASCSSDIQLYQHVIACHCFDTRSCSVILDSSEFQRGIHWLIAHQNPHIDHW